MAKGDDSRARNRIDFSANRGSALGENLRAGTLEPNVNMFRNYFAPTANDQIADYGKIMGGYNEFSKTGGFSPEDISAIRARSISPVRAMYANANRDVNRQRSLQGGYSPGFGVLEARMAREGSQATSDAATNAEASIAEMRQRGKLAGMSGASSLYGTTPGMTAMFGNQLLGASGQLAGAVGNEMDFGNQVARNQIAASGIPGKFEQTTGRIKDIFDLGARGGQVLSMF